MLLIQESEAFAFRKLSIQTLRYYGTRYGELRRAETDDSRVIPEFFQTNRGDPVPPSNSV